jgi:hypothetical protein
VISSNESAFLNLRRNRCTTGNPGPDSITVGHCAKADLFFKQGDLDEAQRYYTRALQVDPDNLEAIDGLGAVSLLKGDFEKAISCYGHMTSVEETADAWRHLGNAFFYSGKFDEGLRQLRRALELDPQDIEARLGIAFARLLFGQLREGWALYECRLKKPSIFARTYSEPIWAGEDICGKRILIHSEQGLGDSLQFVRYVSMVAARGARVVLEVQPELLRLLSNLKSPEQVISVGDSYAPVSWRCPMLSLPRVFGTELSTIPSLVPYLSPDPQEADLWSDRLARPGHFKIGLAWAGSPQHPRNRERSVPLSLLLPLFHLPQVSVWSLQKGAAAQQARTLGTKVEMGDLASSCRDMAETAAAIMALDLVICVDTAVAHLAGALGKPVWILLTHVPDWRWFLHREDSPWYTTAKLFRQPMPGAWEPVITRAASQLEKLAGICLSARA